ncbi:MAG TPA: AMP-binding protein, partial [Polyangiaceae bacterium]|nr:AMP-binding protein [Polyangiaceae bacterium]
MTPPIAIDAALRALDRGDDSTTYVEVLRLRAEATPDALAFAFLDESEKVSRSLTYAELDARARAIAVELGRTLSPGDRAILLYPPGIDFIEAFMGCLYAGVVAVPMAPPLPARLRTAGPRLAATLRRADPRVVLTCSSSRYVKGVEQLLEDGAKLRWLETDSITNLGAVRWRRPAGLRRDDVAFLQFTSGSTASPKGVMVTHGNLLANTTMMLEAFEVDSRDVFCHWLPLFHDMGLIGCTLAPLRAGSAVYFMAPADFLTRPIRWLRAMTRFGGTVAPAPNFSYDLCVRKTSEEERA